MQDRPTFRELLEAVEHFLERDVVPALAGPKQYHARVAANVMRILARELELGPASSKAEWQRLDSLLGAEPAPDDVRKFAAAIERRTRDLCGRIVVGGHASASLRASAGSVCPTLLDAFERCFREQVCLGFQYTDRVGATTQRRVEPHGIYVEVPVWYVLAIDIDKDARRMFRMDRIANPRPFARRFTPSRIIVEEMIAHGPAAHREPPGRSDH